MAESINRERLQPSLLDRLTDLAPDVHRESLDQQTLTMTQVRQAVLRDIAWLLNTTNLAAVEEVEGFPRVAASTLNFGVPGFAGMVTADERPQALESAVREAIIRFEPRIRGSSLQVRAGQRGDDEAVPKLVFEIRGELWAQPVPLQLFLETSIDIETRLAVVTDIKARG